MNGFASRMLPAALVALLLSATSFGIGIATGSTHTAHATHAAKLTIEKVIDSKTVEPDTAGDAVAKCPAGYQVISGGFEQGAIDAVVLRAIMIQHPSPGFEVKILRLPGSVTITPTSLTAIAYCAPEGVPMVEAKRLADASH
jgi:hypothetical protein